MTQNKSIKEMLDSKNLISVFIIVSFLFFPLYVLFIGGAIYSKIILLIVTTLVLILSLLLLAKFSYFFAEFINSKSDQFGDLYLKYIHYVIPSLIMLKVAGYAIYNMLPKKHEGILCDLVRFIKDLFFMFRYHEVLNHLIVGSFLVLIIVLAIRMVKR
jgi:hypothetical protein